MMKHFIKNEQVICKKYGRNNSDMIKGEKYTVSKVDSDGMIKLKGHPDWWSPERFKRADRRVKKPSQKVL